MQRYPAYDPPEYVDWSPHPDVMTEFQATLDGHPDRWNRIQQMDVESLLEIYRGLLRFRLHDIALKRWVRQGVISKAWLGTGEEAVTIGNTHALLAGDLVGPMIRNAGACHEMGMPLADLFRAYLGTADQITQGRDLHTGDLGKGVVPPISFVASLVPVMAGMALASQMRNDGRVALTWVGDGASRTAEFHEGINFAAVRNLPLIVVLQDNGVALGTPRDLHSLAPLKELGKAYGINTLSCDGNNVLDVWAASGQAVERCRSGGGPVLLVASTFRMGGHATHDEAEARDLFPDHLFGHWGKRDPVGMFEEFLRSRPYRLDGSEHTTSIRETNDSLLRQIEEQVTATVEAASDEALQSQEHRMPAGESALQGVLAQPGSQPAEPAFPPGPLRGTDAAMRT